MSQDENKNQANNHAEGTDFVVPEPDGIKSGYPIDDGDMDSDDSIVAHETLRKPSARSKSSETISESSYLNDQRGMSIKTKLISSMAGLTVVIICIGLISYFSIYKINYISNVIADYYTTLAQLSDQIKSTVYKIRDAEKDFLLVEEQEALNRASRFTERLRGQISNAKDIGKIIEDKEGLKMGGQYENMFEAVENYDNMFAQQVKDIKKARTDIDDNISNMLEYKKQLLNKSDANHLLLKTLNENFWLDIQRQLKSKDGLTTEVQLLIIGNLLNQLEKMMLYIQVNIAYYFGNERKSTADAAKEYIKTAIDLTHRIYREAEDEKIQVQVEKIRQNLNIYSSFFNEVIDSVELTKKKKTEIDRRILSQKSGLKKEGDYLISLASEISNNNWDNISNQNTSLTKISYQSQFIVIILAFVGAILGIFVLIYIPRPILTGIQQLLAAAQNISSGNLRTTITLKSSDELGQLSKTFELMRKNLADLVGRIQRASVQISTSVNEIQAASNQQSSTANEQSTALNEFNSTQTEISRTSSNLSNVSEQVYNNATTISKWVDETNGKSSQILESMNAISSSTKLTSDRIKSLNDQMDNINDAVITISGIADQTTLLSLNAAIEANKAGELGKGFAVVATEIRRLSDRSIDSAGSITTMVRDIQRATENSVVAMDKSSEEIRIGIDMVKDSTQTLSGINNSMSQIQEQISEISVSSKDQAESAQQTYQTTSELLTSSKMVAQASKQTLTAALELNAMANQLRDAVSAFQI
ncbi:MAG: Sensory transducer protein [Candidatus Magnetoglobus multicellularis str. Araruama]|uniref:Sensory transducer protein n=1 Tax=Candidatus Magnetoglobus multicellularis str. Araruama TaxID=890399 RepID=A0A1V1PGK4_9BACT|nr:MAG: Sensory transducer protein [Candidatus Magnetoglobus multicellularis str. Araruama]